MEAKRLGRPPAKEPLRVIGVRLTESQIQRIDEYTDAVEGLTGIRLNRSEAVRGVVAQWLKNATTPFGT